MNATTATMLLQIFSHLLVSLIFLNLQFSSIFSSRDFSPSILQKLASEVRESESEDMVGALSDLMTHGDDDPRKMRREIVKLVRDPKFQRASDGRRTVKAIKLPTGIVQLLNAEISVNSKKEILDNVLGLLNKKVKVKEVKSNRKVIKLKEENNIEIVSDKKPRLEKSFDEEPLATYSGSPLNSGDNYFGWIFSRGVTTFFMLLFQVIFPEPDQILVFPPTRVRSHQWEERIPDQIKVGQDLH